MAGEFCFGFGWDLLVFPCLFAGVNSRWLLSQSLSPNSHLKRSASHGTWLQPARHLSRLWGAGRGSIGLGARSVVYGAQSPGHALLSAAKFRFGAVPSFLAAVGTSGTCCLCPPSPAQIQGARGSLKAAGCREPEHRAQGWGWEHGREEEGCPSHLSKSVLGLSRSKCFLHLCWHSSGAGEPFSGAGPPPGFLWDAPAGMQQPQGKQSIPKSWGQPGESW